MTEKTETTAIIPTGTQTPAATPRARVLSQMAARLSIDPEKLLQTLKSTAFREAQNNEQFMALCIVANQYGLNPLTREIYAFPDQKRGGVVPVVGVDGWLRIINQHPEFDGMEVKDEADGSACTAIIHRKDRKFPTVATEYLAECKRNTDPWRTHPRRMLRHKAIIQAARMAFGFVGIYDGDEAERIAETPTAAQVETEEKAAGAPAGAPSKLRARLLPPAPQDAAGGNVEAVERQESDSRSSAGGGEPLVLEA